MTTLGLDEERTEPRKGFWRRQFQTEATEPQRTFDWTFGVILPVICFVFDPIVFKGNLDGTAFLGGFKPFAYALSYISIMVMAAWLIWGEKLKWLNAFTAGLFAVGGAISLAVGIVLFPISLLGLIVLIGVLGFTPLFTSIVFLRNAARAFQAAKPFLEKKILIYSFGLSALLAATLPYVLNVEIKNDLDAISRGDAQTIRAKARRLKFVAPLVNFDSLARQYALEDEKINPERKAALGEAYENLTGENTKSAARGLD